MKTVLHNLQYLPPNHEYYEMSDLSEYDEQKLSDLGVLDAFYWYGSGSYEGTGQILMRDKNGDWHLHDAGHCSCYGPTDEISLRDGWATLGEMQQHCSNDLWKDVLPLVHLAIEKGFK